MTWTIDGRRVLVAALAVAALLAAPAVYAESCTADAGNPAALPCWAATGEEYNGWILGLDSPDGNDTEGAVEAVLGYVTGAPVDLTEAQKFDPPGNTSVPVAGFTITGYTDSGFNWSYTGLLTLAYVTVKATGGFAVFDITGLTSGSISLAGLTEHDISHFSFWSTGVSTPEPGTLFLLGAGLLGLGALRARRRG